MKWEFELCFNFLRRLKDLGVEIMHEKLSIELWRENYKAIKRSLKLKMNRGKNQIFLKIRMAKIFRKLRTVTSISKFNLISLDGKWARWNLSSVYVWKIKIQTKKYKLNYTN